ncbi:MAG: hypothetical protein L6R19_13555 [Alphaproteobacteria bacterium]|nr:hypothetical protein [Alphaproteobacteria bacterium]
MTDSVADTEAIRRYVVSFYAALTFREGGQPNWDMLRGLFWPQAQIIEIRRGETGSQTPAEFIASLRGRIARGELRAMQDRDTGSTIKQQGDLAQVFSPFEGRRDAATVRGVNAFQLARREGRWVCLSILRSEEAALSEERRVLPAVAPPDRPPPRRPGGPMRFRR